MITLRDVSKIYDKKVTALKNIDLQINEGEFVSIVGRSGSGKTTLIKSIIAEERPTSGNIIVDKWQVSKIKKRKIPFYRRQIGVVFQDIKLLTRKTIYENVAFSMMVREMSNSQIRVAVPKVLSLVGLHDKGNRFPPELSGGEQQRAAIARAFVHRPSILIADEPTGELDVLYAWEIMEILLKINKLGTTVVVATHDKDIVNKIHKRVITLEEGQMIKDQAVGKYLI